jgi:hypothetical protein
MTECEVYSTHRTRSRAGSVGPATTDSHLGDLDKHAAPRFYRETILDPDVSAIGRSPEAQLIVTQKTLKKLGESADQEAENTGDPTVFE